jgi:AraC-like DNA-binding protein
MISVLGPMGKTDRAASTRALAAGKPMRPARRPAPRLQPLEDQGAPAPSQCTNRGRGRPEPREHRTAPGPAQALADVRAFIDRHYAQTLSVARLAGRAGLSPFHFIRRFRTAFGATPHQYLRARRLDRARELLVTTPWPVTEICHAVGFRSLGTFSSLFRQATGETPGEYRARRRRHAYIPACFIRMYRAE